MKRAVFTAVLTLSLLLASAALAARARYLAYDGDTAFHSRHLSMHVGDETCRACGNYLKVRSRAGGSASVTGHVEQADLLQLLEVSGNWARIRVLYSADTSPDSWSGLTGWVDASYLECGCSERTYYAGGTDAIEGGEILSGGVNLRELPSGSSRSLGKCTRGERVRVLGRYAESGRTFYRVVRRSGQNGFVSGDYLSLGGSAPQMNYSSGTYDRDSYGQDTYRESSGTGSIRATTYQLRVRETPGGEIVGHISQLDSLQLLERSGSWARIRVTAARSGYDDCYNGLTGWVSTSYLDLGGSYSGSTSYTSSFTGSYTGNADAGTDEENELTVWQSGSGVGCRLILYRLTVIDAYGTDRGGWLDLEGSDAAGNPIRFVVTRISGSQVMVTVTRTTWTYLSDGDTFYFRQY
ncbi:MAG: SH3 domain-containing protein [Clostridia bacterium]|nr:SH3 domain-containing protein [Clostridia bacterium]